MATIYAASTSHTDVQSALNSASDGDTVIIPAGSSTWTANVNTTKRLTIQGAGASSTIFTDGLNKDPFPNVPQMLTWTVPAGGPSRLTGMTWQGSAVDGNNAGMVSIDGVTSQMRIDHTTFRPNGTSALFIYGYVRGVIDHNLFDLSAAAGYGIYIHHHTWDTPGSGFGDASWAGVDSIGNADAMYVEDNTFLNDQGVTLWGYANDGWMGSRVVYRYNTYTNTLCENHGTETGGRWRSQRQFEIYNNTFSFTNGAAVSAALGIRGGTGVVYNNAVSVTGGAFLGSFCPMEYYRQTDHSRKYAPWGWSDTISVDSVTSSGTTATATLSVEHGLLASQNFWVTIVGASPAGYSGTFRVQTVPTTTSFTYTLAGSLSSPATGTITMRQPWDESTDTYGYPALDQPGRGDGDLISDFDPTPVGVLNQALAPIYNWDNTINSAPTTMTSNSPLIVLNRDFYNSAKPGYSPYTYPHPLTIDVSSSIPLPPGGVVAG